jgi:hypothetical protein
LKLSPVRKLLPPEKTTTFRNDTTWANPLVWGIGGKYGNPDMYDLVSDVLIDGKLVDRYIQPFGFREFWIHVTDFFLNGKRIFLRGDQAHDVSNRKLCDILWRLLRHDGINIIRYHDSDAQWCGEAADAGDRMGMLSFVQMYSQLPYQTHGKIPQARIAWEEWIKSREHQDNVANYTRWHRLFRNNPSVVIWSTDNEVYSPSRKEFSSYLDSFAANYEKLVKSFDPDLVMTRDGGGGTWSHRGPWFENPPCDTANYHYPEFNMESQLFNWQYLYDYRPIIYGETIYHGYGYWQQLKGALPELVARRAEFVRYIAGLYNKLEVPGAIFIGLSDDGFILRDEPGKGNQWGNTDSEYLKHRK